MPTPCIAVNSTWSAQSVVPMIVELDLDVVSTHIADTVVGVVASLKKKDEKEIDEEERDMEEKEEKEEEEEEEREMKHADKRDGHVWHGFGRVLNPTGSIALF